ncbi:lysozyme inhibitor LprI family protein [Chitinimonas sp. BJB300]|uniref:lysozyme inhibitor LprI family protein n=1 Tax=Chitinimonas sp. BJB300 TaxID=1559339 RepID=UPI000C11AB0F|nr:lysozyme inhibitor LprI family protein [Chitinimonas sp. BJB300]PHV13377.1 hypothetical protein CSQ89_01050 [Chitinimonas sp. BJB300]TSJ85294.1 DUF1311 domain-containing protein [Chitinimonas sp. BJB300]
MTMNLRLRVLAAIVIPLLSSFAAQAEECSEESVKPFCIHERTQNEYDRADKTLNAAYKKVLKAISKPKEDGLDYPLLKTKFIEAQRQWLRFRDSECNAWYVVNEAGADRNFDETACLVKRMQDRTRQLEEWLAYLP